MSVFSKVDMGEVTRLTRAGRLAEAMALLQGRTSAGASQANSKTGSLHADDGASRSPTIDMTAPSTPRGAWTDPEALVCRGSPVPGDRAFVGSVTEDAGAS